jgi:multidrug transporter EmrE-like cation transporter
LLLSVKCTTNFFLVATIIWMAKVLIALYILTTSSALILLKLGAKTGAPLAAVEGRIHLNLNPLVVGGITLYGTSFLIYTYLVAKYDLGYIIPLTTALVYVMIFTASFFIFKENFTALKITGIVLILSGVVFLNLNK